MKIHVTKEIGYDPQVVAGRPVSEHYVQLAAALEDDPELLHLFAEPYREPGEGETQWMHYGGGDDKGALDDQPPDVQAALRQKLTDRIERIEARAEAARASGTTSGRHFADSVAAALTVPDRSAIRVVGDEPVLAGWGLVRSGESASRRILEDIVAQSRRERATSRASGASQAAAARGLETTASPIARSERQSDRMYAAGSAGTWIRDALDDRPRTIGRGWVPWLLWALAALLLLLLLWLYLAHCAFLRKGVAPERWFFSYCPAVDRAASRDIALLEDNLRRLERDYYREEALCRRPEGAALEPDVPPPAGDPGQDAVPPPETTPQDEPSTEEDAAAAPSTESEERVDEAGGTLGRVNLILSWDTTDDLDMYVNCPDGSRINFSNRRACGGTLDVDANVSSSDLTDRPVENVVFSDAAPPGTYTVEVKVHNPRETPDGEVPFIVELAGVVDGARITVERMEGTAAATLETVLTFMLPLEAP